MLGSLASLQLEARDAGGYPGLDRTMALEETTSRRSGRRHRSSAPRRG